MAISTLQLPIRLGGFGFRPVSLVSPAAFWSAAAQATRDIVEFIPAQKHKSLLYEPASYLPFAANVYAAHKMLLSAGVQSGSNSILPSKPEGFWALYGKDASLTHGIIRVFKTRSATPRESRIA